MLELIDVPKHFFGVATLRCISFSELTSEVLDLIGLNGSDKSTGLNVISALVSATRGETRFPGNPNAGVGATQMDKRGLERPF